jgi:hypothetical protein
MNKFVFAVVFLAVVIVTLGSVGVAYAQSPNQTTGTGSGWMGGSESRGAMGAGTMTTDTGILHDYMISAYSEALGIPAADLEARLDSGETMAQVALSTGLTLDEFHALMIDVRSQAIDQALSDGVLTQAQADWMKLRGAGQMGAGRGMYGSGQGQFNNPNCPYYNSSTP